MQKRGAFHLFLLNKVLYNMGESYASPKVLAPVYLQELLIHGLLVPKRNTPRSGGRWERSPISTGHSLSD